MRLSFVLSELRKIKELRERLKIFLRDRLRHEETVALRAAEQVDGHERLRLIGHHDAAARAERELHLIAAGGRVDPLLIILGAADVQRDLGERALDVPAKLIFVALAGNVRAVGLEGAVLVNISAHSGAVGKERFGVQQGVERILAVKVRHRRVQPQIILAGDLVELVGHVLRGDGVEIVLLRQAGGGFLPPWRRCRTTQGSPSTRRLP